MSKSLQCQAIDLFKSWGGFDEFAFALDKFSQVQVFLAGGVIRDILSSLGRQSKDFDFFISGPDSDDFLKFLGMRGSLTVGPFGSPRWFPNDSRCSYADIIPVQYFYNGLWRCVDIVDVLNQFDFTANAIAIDVRSSELFDPQNGVRDAQSRLIRAVRFDYPNEPISSNCLLSRLSVLWNRIVYYSELLKFEVEPVTQCWLIENSHFSNDLKQFRKVFSLPEN